MDHVEESCNVTDGFITVLWSQLSCLFCGSRRLVPTVVFRRSFKDAIQRPFQRSDPTEFSETMKRNFRDPGDTDFVSAPVR